MAKKPTYEELAKKIQELKRSESERKKAEDALKESERNLKRAQHLSKIGSWYYDWDSDTEVWSDECFKLYGINKDYYPDNIVPESLSLSLSSNPEEIANLSTSLAEKNDTYELEYTTIPINGQLKTIHSYCEVERDNNGNVLKVFGADHDITELRQAEEELQKLALVVKYSSELVNLATMDGKMIFLNEAGSKMLGIRPDEVEQYNIMQVIPDHLKELVESKLLPALMRGNTWEGDLQYRNVKTDKLTDVHAMTFTVKEPNTGNVLFLANVSLDITERKRARDALKQSEELFRLIFQVSPDSISITGPKDEYIDVNTGFTIGSGYTREETLGKTSEDLNLWVDKGELEDVRKTLAENSIINNFEARFRGKDGSISDALFSATVFEMNGEYHTLSVTKNINELKEAQKEQSRLEAQLQHVQKMESIGTLAGGIAHDFNNLLMGIQGKTSVMLYNHKKNDAFYDQLKSIEQMIQSGSEITNQLLGYARKGKFDIKPEDLNNLVENSSKMFASTKKGIKIHTKYQKNIWAVEIDKNQIDQVLLNLFVNASQAMPKGGDLYIETENVILDEVYVKPHLIKPGEFVKISVTDTGTGMDEATRQNIFDPFFTTKDTGKGTGLGLASAYGIIKNHKGIINAYSEKGIGSSFNIYLPVTDKKITDDIKPPDNIKKGSETILLIDDEQRIIDAGKGMLEIVGYKVLLAASGKKAIETYRKKSKTIDLVILDMILPEMDGSEIYDRLKGINPNVKVLLSSGFTQNGQAKEIIDKGCNGFIQKPFTLEQLSQKISEILNME